jgi:hypothetical protein
MSSFLQKLVGVACFTAPFQSHEKQKFLNSCIWIIYALFSIHNPLIMLFFELFSFLSFVDRGREGNLVQLPPFSSINVKFRNNVLAFSPSNVMVLTFYVLYCWIAPQKTRNILKKLRTQFAPPVTYLIVRFCVW